MSNVLDSFFAVLGFETDTAGLQEFTDQVESARSVALGLGAALLATTAAVTLFVGQIANSLDELGDFAEKEQVAVEAIQELGHAAQLNGSSLEAVKSSIASVNKSIGEAALGVGRAAKVFDKLGFDVKGADGKVKDFDTLIGEVAKRMEGLSRQEQIAMAEKLGIDSSLVPLLAKGAAALEEYRAEARAFGVATTADTETAGQFMDSLDRTKFVVLGLSNAIAVKLMPPITRLMDTLRAWFMANREIIKSTIEKSVRALTNVVEFLTDWLGRLLAVGGRVVDWLDDLGIASKLAAVSVGVLVSWMVGHSLLGFIAQIASLVRWIMALNVAALAIPIAIGAIITVLALLVDDFVNFKEGGESVIGDLVAKFPQLLEVIAAIEEGVSAFFGFMLGQWETLQGPVTELMAALFDLASVIASTLWPVVKMIFSGWVMLMSALIPPIANLIKWIAQALAYSIRWWIEAFTTIAKFVTVIFEALAGPVGAFFSFMVSVVESTITFILGAFAAMWGVVSTIFSTVAGGVATVFDFMRDGIASAVKWALGLVDSATERVRAFLGMIAGGVRTVTDFLGLTTPAPAAQPGAALAAGVEVPRVAPVQRYSGKITPAPATLTDARRTAAPARTVPGATLTTPSNIKGTPAVDGAPTISTPIMDAVRQAPTMRNADPSAPPAEVRSPAVRGATGEIGAVSATTNNRNVSTTTITKTNNVGGITVVSNDPARAGESVRFELDRVTRESVRNGQSMVDI